MASENPSRGGRVPWSSMQQSWGPALLILAAVVLVEGEPPRVSGQGSGVAGPPLSQQACSSGGVRVRARGATVGRCWCDRVCLRSSCLRQNRWDFPRPDDGLCLLSLSLCVYPAPLSASLLLCFQNDLQQALGALGLCVLICLSHPSWPLPAQIPMCL